MIITPSLGNRICVAKGIGFLFGLVGMIAMYFFWPETSWMFRFGILAWYTTMGGIVGLFGVSTFHPILKMNLKWWFIAPLLGGWMNFVLTLFTYDTMAAIMVSTFGVNGIASSPFWFAAEGAVVGLLIAFFALHFGGDD